MIKLSASLAVFLYAAPAWADPPSTVLQAVKIETSSGVITGFATYMDFEYSDLIGSAPKPDDFAENSEDGEPAGRPPTDAELRKLLLSQKKILVYPDLQWVTYPRRLLVQTSPIVKLDRSAIRKVSFIPDKLNRYSFYGVVNQVSPADVMLLNSAPVHYCTEKCAASLICPYYYWASYDPKVGPEKLEPICTEGWSYKPERKKDVEAVRKNPRVFRLEESND